VLLLSVVSLTLFLLLSKYEDRPVMRNVDFSVTVKVQEKIDTSSRLRLAALAGNVMEGATFFASPEFTVIVTLLLTSFSLFDWKKRRWNPKAIFIPIALTLLVILEIYGKSIVHHPSPPFSMIKNPITMFPANYVNEQFSYPSGHAARAVFMAIVSYYVLRLSAGKAGITYYGKRNRYVLQIGLFGYVVLVGISRIYLGHHWFSDVLGGWLLGTGLGFIAFL